MFGRDEACYHDPFTGPELASEWTVIDRNTPYVVVSQNDSLDLDVARIESGSHVNGITSKAPFDLRDGWVQLELVTVPEPGVETNFVLLRRGTPDYYLYNLQNVDGNLAFAAYVGRELIEYRAYSTAHRHVRFIHRAAEDTIAFEVSDLFATEWSGMQIPTPFPVDELDLSIVGHNIAPTPAASTIRWDNVIVKSGPCVPDPAP